MPLPVALKEVVDGLEMVDDSIKAYINRKTGEIVEGTLEQELSAESDEPSDDWPDWQVEEWKQTRRVLKSKDFIALPSQFEIHEWSIMERFAQSLENEDDRDTLLERPTWTRSVWQVRADDRRAGRAGTVVQIPRQRAGGNRN